MSNSNDNNNNIETNVDTNTSLPNVDEDLMLTTIDNPYSPKTDYDKWRVWDVDNGYNTEEYLARITDVPDGVDVDDELAIAELTNKAIQDILNNDILGVYKLV